MPHNPEKIPTAAEVEDARLAMREMIDAPPWLPWWHPKRWWGIVRGY